VLENAETFGNEGLRVVIKLKRSSENWKESEIQSSASTVRPITGFVGTIMDVVVP
jgi:hypothetical protein